MLKQAVITSVLHGVEHTHEVEDTDTMTYYAKVVGTVRGITASGAVVTNIEELGDPF